MKTKVVACPKVVTVFGREVKLRGDINRARVNVYDKPESSGKQDGVRVQVARTYSDGFMVRVTVGHVEDWKWSKNKSLSKAIANAERHFLKRLAADEARCSAAREIVGRT